MGGRVVEGTGLENQQACERLVGSNPTPSAIRPRATFKICFRIKVSGRHLRPWFELVWLKFRELK